MKGESPDTIGELVFQGMMCPEEREISLARITCQAAAMREISCRECGDILDREKVTVFEVKDSNSGEWYPFSICCNNCIFAVDKKLTAITRQLQGEVSDWIRVVNWEKGSQPYVPLYLMKPHPPRHPDLEVLSTLLLDGRKRWTLPDVEDQKNASLLRVAAMYWPDQGILWTNGQIALGSGIACELFGERNPPLEHIGTPRYTCLHRSINDERQDGCGATVDVHTLHRAMGKAPPECLKASPIQMSAFQLVPASAVSGEVESPYAAFLYNGEQAGWIQHQYFQWLQGWVGVGALGVGWPPHPSLPASAIGKWSRLHFRSADGKRAGCVMTAMNPDTQKRTTRKGKRK